MRDQETAPQDDRQEGPDPRLYPGRRAAAARDEEARLRSWKVERLRRKGRPGGDDPTGRRQVYYVTTMHNYKVSLRLMIITQGAKRGVRSSRRSRGFEKSRDHRLRVRRRPGDTRGARLPHGKVQRYVCTVGSGDAYSTMLDIYGMMMDVMAIPISERRNLVDAFIMKGRADVTRHSG